MTAAAAAIAGGPGAGEGEGIETAALESLHRVATPELIARLGLGWDSHGSARLSRAAALPPSAIVVNRALGVRAGMLDSIAAAYRAKGVARFFLHPAPAEPDLAGPAAAAGLVPARAWQKFERPRGAPLPPVSPVAITRIQPGTPEATAAARLVCAAFDLGAQAEPWLARLALDPRWQVFLAQVDGQPAGTGALFVADGVGWLDWGATDPAFRSRGIQRALLAHRLRLADALGIPRTHTCTGLPVPGDPQHSYRNILRCGFLATTVRPNWQPASPD